MTRLILIGLFSLGAMSAPAFACDEMCKDSEYYSDSDEMCLPKPVGT